MLIRVNRNEIDDRVRLEGRSVDVKMHDEIQIPDIPSDYHRAFSIS